jgi:selenide,water dikinase
VKLSTQQNEILFDPQTSGGLLLAVPADQADRLTEKLRAAGVEAAAIIGEAAESPHPVVRIV